MKKGFTLVEIILSVGLIVLVMSISIFSFNIVKSKNKEKTLNNMSDEILTALRLYIETNKESNVSLYEHYGFELKETALVPKSDVTHYAMVRAPKELKKEGEK